MLHAVLHLAEVQITGREVLLGELLLGEFAVFPAALIGVSEMVNELAEAMPVALVIHGALIDCAVLAGTGFASLDERQSDVEAVEALEDVITRKASPHAVTVRLEDGGGIVHVTH